MGQISQGILAGLKRIPTAVISSLKYHVRCDFTSMSVTNFQQFTTFMHSLPRFQTPVTDTSTWLANELAEQMSYLLIVPAHVK